MLTCSMCRKAFEVSEGADEYFVTDDKPICPKCAEQLETLLESKDANAVHKAINYVYTCQKASDDPIVINALEEILENNASAVDEIKQTQNRQRKSGPVQFSSDTDYFREKEAEEEASGLFGNVGGKIKGATTVCCWIGIICCVLTGLVMLFGGAVIAGLLYGVVGSLLCWLVSLTTYAFGELLVVTQKNNQLLAEILKATKSQKTKK